MRIIEKVMYLLEQIRRTRDAGVFYLLVGVFSSVENSVEALCRYHGLPIEEIKVSEVKAENDSGHREITIEKLDERMPVYRLRGRQVNCIFS